MIRKETYIVLIIISLLFLSCKKTIIEDISSVLPTFDTVKITAQDSFRVGTIYGSTSYFNYRDEMMGYDYQMARHLADYLKLKIKIIVAKDESELTKMLNENEIDLAAYNFIITKELKSQFSFVFPQPESQMVLVQNIGIRTISDATELNGKTVYVKPNTAYHNRLVNLNKEIGGEITIKFVPDSISHDELLEMIANKNAEFTVASNRTAQLYKSQFKGLDCRMPITFNLKNGWLINKDDTTLLRKIETWLNEPKTKQYESNRYIEYWEKSPYFASKKIRIPKGAISPYDAYFKKYALEINWDWQLLAAVAFHESGFDGEQVS
ncbi:MAG TPA: lytic transglycosylase F, partial [Paludibacter sp.]|nr:lytic transglycosylase F [Paludibacter sp.]